MRSRWREVGERGPRRPWAPRLAQARPGASSSSRRARGAGCAALLTARLAQEARLSGVGDRRASRRRQPWGRWRGKDRLRPCPGPPPSPLPGCPHLSGGRAKALTVREPRPVAPGRPRGQADADLSRGSVASLSGPQRTPRPNARLGGRGDLPASSPSALVSTTVARLPGRSRCGGLYTWSTQSAATQHLG